MQFAKINDVNLHFQHITAPEGSPVLVFSNSLATDFRIWRDVIVRLVGNAEIITYDNRGHGLSDLGTSPYKLDELVADLAGLLDFIGKSDVFICGLSVGGMIAQRLAALRPDLAKGLILCDTATKIGDSKIWEKRIRTARSEGLSGLLDANMQRWFTQDFRSHHADELAGYCNMFLRTPLEGYVGTATALRDADLTAAAAHLNLPVICVVGEDDGSTPPELVLNTANLIPNADFKLIKGAAHIPCVEQPEMLSEIILKFLTEHSKNSN
jgi:3-oxoadipate enol-lactonase